MTEKKRTFVKGVTVFEPSENAPDFVLGTVAITIPDLMEWIEDNQELMTEYNGKEQLKLSILKPREGRRLSMPVDEFKPERKHIGGTPFKKKEKDLPF